MNSCYNNTLFTINMYSVGVGTGLRLGGWYVQSLINSPFMPLQKLDNFFNFWGATTHAAPQFLHL